MSNDKRTEHRLQLLANGYMPIPTYGKMAKLPGWNTAEYVQRELVDHPRRTAISRIGKWPMIYPKLQSTGVRVEERLVVIDIDVDVDTMVDLINDKLQQIAPDVYDRAPVRFGGGTYKMALFMRLHHGDEPFVRLASHKYRDGVSEHDHCVEVFGSGLTQRGHVARHVGVDGPHSYNDDGSVAREYVWLSTALWEVPRQELPSITRAQVAELIDFFDAKAIEAGWKREERPREDAGETAYDIDGASRFVMQGGDVLSYDELQEGMRCASSFSAGDTGTNTSKCSVLWSARHDCIGVYNHETLVWHYPSDKGVSADVLGQQLREVAAENGISLSRIVEPNWRERYENGRPKASLHNARLAIEAVGIRCTRDIFHNRLFVGRLEASDPLLPFFGEVSDTSITMMRGMLSDVFGRDFTEKHIRDAVVLLCEENRFDPVLDMLAEAEANWDGRHRLDRMAVEHFNADDTELNRAMVRKTMIAAVARARLPGIKFDTILTMESAEGYNKSSAWRLLAGPENFSDESIIGRQTREVQEQLAGVWIHENAELAGMRKAEVETVKAFASRTVDRARPSYGRFLVEQPRRSIEVATTNSDKYLLSMTGNRRFWPLRVNRSIDLGRLKRERLQLWGEAAAAQSAGESLVLPEHLWAIAGQEQEDRRVRHPWEAKLAALTSASAAPELAGVGRFGNGIVDRTSGEDRVSTADIFEFVLKVPDGQLNMGHAKTLADIMKVLGWRHGMFKRDGRVVKGYTRTAVTGSNP